MPRRIKVSVPDSQFFSVRRASAPGKEEGSKVASGMEVVYTITFKPQVRTRACVYVCERVSMCVHGCMRERVLLCTCACIFVCLICVPHSTPRDLFPRVCSSCTSALAAIVQPLHGDGISSNQR